MCGHITKWRHKREVGWRARQWCQWRGARKLASNNRRNVRRRQKVTWWRGSALTSPPPNHDPPRHCRALPWCHFMTWSDIRTPAASQMWSHHWQPRQKGHRITGRITLGIQDLAWHQTLPDVLDLILTVCYWYSLLAWCISVFLSHVIIPKSGSHDAVYRLRLA